LAGFALLLMGNFIYNEILKIKCCGMDKYIRDNFDDDGNWVDPNLKEKMIKKDKDFE